MSEERTEKATPKRRKELRDKGVIARSVELPGAVGLALLVLLLPRLLQQLTAALSAGMTTALSLAGTTDLPKAEQMLGDLLRVALEALVPVVAVVGLGGLLTGVLVTRARPHLGAVRPKAERVNPKHGIKRFVSKQVLFDFLRTAGKLALVGAAVASSVRSAVVNLMSGPAPVGSYAGQVGDGVRSLLWRVVVAAAVVGVLDAWWARRRYNKQARMTKQEIREESKSSEGNPHVKSAIRQRQMKMSRMRMIEAVAKADVVLANPTHVAVALSYAENAAAPVVVAKGAGAIASRIKDEARAHDVPIVENKPLARALWRGVEIGDVIPVEFYEAVARVLAVVFATRRRRRAA